MWLKFLNRIWLMKCWIGCVPIQNYFKSRFKNLFVKKLENNFIKHCKILICYNWNGLRLKQECGKLHVEFEFEIKLLARRFRNWRAMLYEEKHVGQYDLRTLGWLVGWWMRWSLINWCKLNYSRSLASN